jgi:TolB-like protein/Tfp pilus assembly protein PilF
MIGRTVSHYRILDKIGEGGMGQVFLADDLELHRKVALKFLPTEYATDAEALARFKREAQAAAALDHPNIVTIYDVGEYEGRPYIVMAYVEGQPLSHVIARKDLSLERALQIAAGVCDALASAHAASVVHRDIKPDNIVIYPDGGPKVLDFGLAKLRGVSKLTTEASTVGTTSYMSPEQARGEDVDARSDIFSLGAVIYEMIAGRPPFKAEHAPAILYAIANEQQPPLARFNSAATEDIERIVAKALAKDKKERYQSAADLLVDLHAAQAALQGKPRPAAAARRVRVPLLAALAVVVIAAAAAAWHFTRPSGEQAVNADRKSIAVLPFQNMSADPENEYFSEGITDDIIAQLSKIADLRVVSRTSVMRYKDSDKSLREIGKELGVATILEGSVRRAEGKVRIVGQLIDARTDEHIWAETYDRDLDEIFQIQSEVAKRIARSLQAALTPDEVQRIQAAPTEDMTAYDYYLRGRQSYYRYRREDNENAIVFFKKALEHDPHYALAYAGLGDAYGQRALRYSFGPAWIDSSLKASERAISLNPDLAEGYKALGMGYIAKGWIRKSLDADVKAAQLDPNYIPALGNIGFDYLWMGRVDEAMPWFRKVLSKEPDDIHGLLGVAGVYLTVGECERARQWLSAALDLQPDFFEAKLMMVGTYVTEGRFDEAEAKAQALADEFPDRAMSYESISWVSIQAGDLKKALESIEEASKRPIGDENTRYYIDANLGCTLALLGERERSKSVLEGVEAYLQEQLQQGDESSDLRLGMAEIRAVQGRNDEALDWLERDYEAGERDYKGIERSPFLAGLHDAERFRTLLADMRARVEEMRRNVLQSEPSP